MPKVSSLSLSSEERRLLEQGSEYGPTPSFRLRCRAILNIAETLWRKLKYEWLRPEDYAVWKALNAVGTTLNIAFQRFNRQNVKPNAF